MSHEFSANIYPKRLACDKKIFVLKLKRNGMWRDIKVIENLFLESTRKYSLEKKSSCDKLQTVQIVHWIFFFQKEQLIISQPNIDIHFHVFH